MSTRIGLISEGPIDMVLLPPLLSHIANQMADYRWPVDAGDVVELLSIRKTGHGGVLEKVRALVSLLEKQPLDYSFFVIVLDRRTREVQEKVRKLITGRNRFVLGIAIEEVEAWWLGDRTNTLQWCGFTHDSLPDCRYRLQDDHGRLVYVAEKDDQPKNTLDDLTQRSDRFDRVYGEGNTGLAADFAERHWRPNAQLKEIATQCPQGFAVFRDDAAQAFRNVAKPARRLSR